MIYDYNKLKKSVSIDTLKKRPFNQLRYLEFYPVRNLFSLGEGGTPLIRSKNIEKELGFNFELYFKNEAVNPTGSFKDRGSTVEISRAYDLNKKIVCTSSGNMGSSLAAYSAVANINCTIFMPHDASKIKMNQILSYGADVYHSKGEYTDVAKQAEYAANKYDLFLAGDYFYRREGTKSLGFELAEQIESDYIFVPIGNGSLLSGTWKGLSEFKILGFSKKLPKIIGIQAKGSSSIKKSISSDLVQVNYSIKKLIHPHTIAVPIEVGFPLDGYKALESVRESKGYMDTVTDKEILKAKNMLAEREGLFAEPAGAASLASILRNKNKIEKGSIVVCLVTGHGLKTSNIVSKHVKPLGKNMDKIF